MSDVLLTSTRLRLREITEADAPHVVRWRNTPEARAGFFSSAVVTLDTHRAFMRARKAHDLVFVFETIPPRLPELHQGDTILLPIQHGLAAFPAPIGMSSITIHDPAKPVGEFGRFIIDPALDGQGYGREGSYLCMRYAFEVLRLESLWLDVFADNDAVVNMDRGTGFEDAGIDIEGHTHPRGPVLHMTLRASAWPGHRERLEAKMGEGGARGGAEKKILWTTEETDKLGTRTRTRYSDGTERVEPA